MGGEWVGGEWLVVSGEWERIVSEKTVSKEREEGKKIEARNHKPFLAAIIANSGNRRS